MFAAAKRATVAAYKAADAAGLLGSKTPEQLRRWMQAAAIFAAAQQTIAAGSDETTAMRSAASLADLLGLPEAVGRDGGKVAAVTAAAQKAVALGWGVASVMKAGEDAAHALECAVHPGQMQKWAGSEPLSASTKAQMRGGLPKSFFVSVCALHAAASDAPLPHVMVAAQQAAHECGFRGQDAVHTVATAVADALVTESARRVLASDAGTR